MLTSTFLHNYGMGVWYDHTAGTVTFGPAALDIVADALRYGRLWCDTTAEANRALRAYLDDNGDQPRADTAHENAHDSAHDSVAYCDERAAAMQKVAAMLTDQRQGHIDPGPPPPVVDLHGRLRITATRDLTADPHQLIELLRGWFADYGVGLPRHRPDKPDHGTNSSTNSNTDPSPDHSANRGPDRQPDQKPTKGAPS